MRQLAGLTYGAPDSGKSLDLANAYGHGLVWLLGAPNELTTLDTRHNLSGVRKPRASVFTQRKEPLRRLGVFVRQKIAPRIKELRGTRDEVRALALDPFSMITRREYRHMKTSKLDGGEGIDGGYAETERVLGDRVGMLADLLLDLGIDIWFVCHEQKPAMMDSGYRMGRPRMHGSFAPEELLERVDIFWRATKLGADQIKDGPRPEVDEDDQLVRCYMTDDREEDWLTKSRIDVPEVLSIEPAGYAGLRWALEEAGYGERLCRLEV